MIIFPERKLTPEQPETAIVHTIISTLHTIEVRVEYQGTTWNAELDNARNAIDLMALIPGQRVIVIDRNGNTLLIKAHQMSKA